MSTGTRTSRKCRTWAGTKRRCVLFVGGVALADCVYPCRRWSSAWSRSLETSRDAVPRRLRVTRCESLAPRRVRFLLASLYSVFIAVARVVSYILLSSSCTVLECSEYHILVLWGSLAPLNDQWCRRITTKSRSSPAKKIQIHKP